MNAQEYQNMYKTYSEWAKQGVHYDKQGKLKPAYHAYLYALGLGTQILIKMEPYPIKENQLGQQKIKLSAISQRIEVIQKQLYEQQKKQKPIEADMMAELERQQEETRKRIIKQNENNQKLQKMKEYDNNNGQKTNGSYLNNSQTMSNTNQSKETEIIEKEERLNYQNYDQFAMMRDSIARERINYQKNAETAYVKDLQSFKMKFTTLVPPEPKNQFEKLLQNEFLLKYPIQERDEYKIEVKYIKELRNIEKSTLKSFEDLEFRDRIKGIFTKLFNEIEEYPGHLLNQLIGELSMKLSPYVSEQPDITAEEVKSIVREFIQLTGALLVSKFWVLQNSEFRHVLSQSINLYMVDFLFKHIEFSLLIPLYRNNFLEPCRTFQQIILQLKDIITPRHLDIEKYFLLDTEEPYPYAPLVHQFSEVMNTPGIMPLLKETTNLINKISEHAKNYWKKRDPNIPNSKFVSSADVVIPIFIYFVIRSGYVGMMPHYLCMDAYIKKNWIPGHYEYSFTIIQSVVHFICGQSTPFFMENLETSRTRYPRSM
mmetsp:Transcript_9841/g.14504  ORF Transcript_9841/g.14504 Transcript_9841/m.14504 type:complete len:541 (-) Transcript_9841:79-1701(-)